MALPSRVQLPSLLVEEPIEIAIPGKRSIVQLFHRPEAGKALALVLDLSVAPAIGVYFAIFDGEQFKRFPKTSAHRSWNAPSVNERIVLPGSGPWYFMVSNPSAETVFLRGTIANGLI